MSSESVGKLAELGIISPWLNVPGFLGYLPPAHPDLAVPLGAFSPPPLSLAARSPARDRTAMTFPGGVLLHTGLPNPGWAGAIRQYGQRWSRLSMPLWLNLIPADSAEAEELSERVDDLDYVAAYQITLPDGISTQEKAAILSASLGEKPFFVELSLNEVCSETISMVQKSGAYGLVLGAPRGMLPQEDGRVSGRLYGPAFYPQLARALEQLQDCGLLVVAGCGVNSVEQGEALLKMGAAAVQFDVAFWS
jgi:dihydroorotate dehydrogenase